MSLSPPRDCMRRGLEPRNTSLPRGKDAAWPVPALSPGVGTSSSDSDSMWTPLLCLSKCVLWHLAHCCICPPQGRDRVLPCDAGGVHAGRWPPEFPASAPPRSLMLGPGHRACQLTLTPEEHSGSGSGSADGTQPKRRLHQGHLFLPAQLPPSGGTLLSHQGAAGACDGGTEGAGALHSGP